MTFLLRYRRILAIAAGIALLLALASHALSKAEQREYERAQSEYALRVAKANADARSNEQAAQRRANEVDHEHQLALQTLEAKYRARPVPAFRVCHSPAGQVPVPAATGAASIDSGTATADGLPGGISPDIGPAVEQRILRPADEQTQRLIACQAYVRSMNRLQ